MIRLFLHPETRLVALKLSNQLEESDQIVRKPMMSE